ncbi:hypothetical protein K0M31_002750 [Melipona bicolor]|uniref:Uncharacterized protein n=1 Tax=Melipona bicolor TaxID=60889 RepID=A0AA40KPU1_9HYME|nr:hypothetical protein K0M31_002750 [Melipona bicolor]
MYFFRLHNLRRQAEEVRKKRQKGRSSQSGQRGTNCTDQSQPTAGSMHCFNRVHRGPSKLFERAPLQPSDSLDEIAFQIPSGNSDIYATLPVQKQGKLGRLSDALCKYLIPRNGASIGKEREPQNPENRDSQGIIESGECCPSVLLVNITSRSPFSKPPRQSTHKSVMVESDGSLICLGHAGQTRWMPLPAERNNGFSSGLMTRDDERSSASTGWHDRRNRFFVKKSRRVEILRE